MNTNQIIQRCANLEARLDERLFARRDEDDKPGAKTVAGGVATVGAAGGGYLAHRAVMDKFGPGSTAVYPAPKTVGGAYREAGKAAMRGVSDAANRAGASIAAGASSAATAAREAVKPAALRGKALIARLLRLAR